MGLFDSIKKLFATSSEPVFEAQDFSTMAVPVITADFTEAYPTAEAERGKFVVADTSHPIYAGLPSDSRGKFVSLTYDVSDLAALDFTVPYSVAEAERGKFVKLVMDPSTGYPADGRGKWAMLTYNVNAGAGLSGNYLPLVGGTMSGSINMNGNAINNATANKLSISECLSTDCIRPYTTDTTPISVYSQVEIISANGVANGIEMNDTPITNVHYIDFDLTHTLTPAEGRMAWNADDGTLEVGMPGGNVNLQIGQELIVPRRVNNPSATDIPNGSLVYIITGGSGTNVDVATADNGVEYSSSNTIAMATEDITGGNGKGYATTFGLVRDLDTSSYVSGQILYLGKSGAYTDVKPTSPDHLVTIGHVFRSHPTEGSILVNIKNGYELEETHDVLITNAQNNDNLTYNAASGLWVNQAPGIEAIETKTATFTVASTSSIILVSAFSSPVTAYLPAAVGNNGVKYTIKKIDSSTNYVTMSANTNIDEQATFEIRNQYDAIEVISNNTQWWII